jgi:hypothetical protein
MALHTIGRFQQEEYAVSNHSSSTAAAFVVGQRSKLINVQQTVKVNQTATAASWTASKNGSQLTGLSSVAVTTSAVGESSGVTSAAPTGGSSEVFLAKGDIISVVGSSLTASNWTFTVQEF